MPKFSLRYSSASVRTDRSGSRSRASTCGSAARSPAVVSSATTRRRTSGRDAEQGMERRVRRRRSIDLQQVQRVEQLAGLFRIEARRDDLPRRSIEDRRGQRGLLRVDAVLLDAVPDGLDVLVAQPARDHDHAPVKSRLRAATPRSSNAIPWPARNPASRRPEDAADGVGHTVAEHVDRGLDRRAGGHG